MNTGSPTSKVSFEEPEIDTASAIDNSVVQLPNTELPVTEQTTPGSTDGAEHVECPNLHDENSKTIAVTLPETADLVAEPATVNVTDPVVRKTPEVTANTEEAEQNPADSNERCGPDSQFDSREKPLVTVNPQAEATLTLLSQAEPERLQNLTKPKHETIMIRDRCQPHTGKLSRLDSRRSWSKWSKRQTHTRQTPESHVRDTGRPKKPTLHYVVRS